MNADSIVLLNGQLVQLADAAISPLDRGFMFGDGVYEMFPAFGQQLYGLGEHLVRLDNSLAQVGIANPYTDEQWTELLLALVDRNQSSDYPDSEVYLQVTRGVPDFRDHAFPEQVHPTVFAMASPLKPLTHEVREAGAAAVVLDDIRWQRCDIKSISLIGNVLLRQQAVEQGAKEAILVRGGLAREGAGSNLFIVRDGCMITPPISTHLLPGVTRNLIIDIAQRQNLALQERDISVEELAQADEMWVSSSVKELLPIVSVDGQPVADGKAGPIWRQVNTLYQQRKIELRQGVAQ